jgi:Ca2+-binding EF-hand superfamily protein
MKNHKTFVLGTLIASNLLACAVENDLNLPISNIETSQNKLSSLSAKGLDDFMNFQAKFVFDRMDKNKNKYISKSEYVEYFTAAAPAPVVEEPQMEVPQVENNNTSILSKDKAISPDPQKRFAFIDKNKDGRITLTEARKSVSNFLGTSKADIRKNVSLMFFYMDKNQNKNLSKQEFMDTFEGVSYETKTSFLAQFNLADKNRNNSLTFSEFEDMYYGISKAYMELPMPAPTASSSAVPVEPPSSAPSDPISSKTPNDSTDQIKIPNIEN